MTVPTLEQLANTVQTLRAEVDVLRSEADIRRLQARYMFLCDTPCPEDGIKDDEERGHPMSTQLLVCWSAALWGIAVQIG